jgi:acid phosphatase type 7
MENQKPSTNRRKFLINAAKVAGVGAAGYLYFKGASEPEDKAQAVPHISVRHYFITKPYLHTIADNVMSVRWITHKKCYSWVEFGEDEKLGQRRHAVKDGMVMAYNRINEIVLDKLHPGKKYYYRVASKDILDFQPYKIVYGETIYSDIHSFETFVPDAPEVSWLILNDIHDTPQSFKKLIGLNKNKPYNFVFLNGDIFNNPQSEGEIVEYLLDPCGDVFASDKPMILLRGNHEARGKFARELTNYFSAPNGQYFYFKHGPVLIIAIDTGEDKDDSHSDYAGIIDFNNYREQQAVWLEELMQSDLYKNALYKVVMMHIPTFYNVEAKGELHCRELFSPLFDKYKVDIVISGHIHKHGVYPPVRGIHEYPIIIGGGPKVGTRTLIRVNANHQRLEVQMLDDSGVEVGNYIIKAK